jgi:hypothetical protein
MSAAGVTAFGTQINDPIRRLDHVHVVLNDQDRAPMIHQPLKGGKQAPDVLEMKTRSGFVKDEKALRVRERF